MNNYTMTAFGSARMDIFVKLPEDEVEAHCRIDKKRCVIELGYGEKIPLVSVNYLVGGNAANLAVGMKRLGIESRLVAELGGDEMADMAYNQLAKELIGMDYVSRTQGTASGLGVVVSYAAERTILSYYSPKRPTFPVGINGSLWAYLTSMGEGFEEYFPSVLSWVRDNNAKLGFNPGGRQIKKGKEWLSKYIEYAEVLLVNREEGSLILADGKKDQMYEDYLSDMKKLCRDLFSMGSKIVVVTDGPGGAYAYNGQTILHMGIFESPVVERTGAGDAFSTGFLAGIINEQDIETSLKWGTVNSASVIGKVGPEEGLLTKEQLNDWLLKAKDTGVEILQ